MEGTITQDTYFISKEACQRLNNVFGVPESQMYQYKEKAECNNGKKI